MIYFTIAVVALNAAECIKKTVESILSQTYTNYEIIVKDGCSKDNTIEMIPVSSKINIYQEKDKSLYDAMNQATHYAAGKYIIYMNCGDLFAADDVLEKVAVFLEKNDCDLLYGDYVRDSIICKQINRITSFYLYRTPLCHQTIFFKTKLLQEDFSYDTSYKILADYNVELGMFKAGKKFLHIDQCICQYLGGGISESKSGIKKKKYERKVILKKHYTIYERICYGIRLELTFPRVRKFLYSSKSPKFVRRAYKGIVNKVNIR